MPERGVKVNVIGRSMAGVETRGTPSGLSLPIFPLPPPPALRIEILAPQDVSEEARHTIVWRLGIRIWLFCSVKRGGGGKICLFLL